MVSVPFLGVTDRLCSVTMACLDVSYTIVFVLAYLALFRVNESGRLASDLAMCLDIAVFCCCFFVPLGIKVVVGGLWLRLSINFLDE